MSMKTWWRARRPGVLAAVGYPLIRMIAGSARIQLVGFEALDSPGSAIVCGWHGRSFLYSNKFRNLGWWVIISNSNDGEMQAGIFRRLGYQVLRGSTNRGGVRAAVGAIRALREGGRMAITPDGPKGPAEVVQGGVMLMAQKSGAPLYPVGISARWRLLVPSWDAYMVPLPFTPAVFVLGEPIFVPADADDEEVEVLRLHLQNEILRLSAEAEFMMGH